MDHVDWSPSPVSDATSERWPTDEISKKDENANTGWTHINCQTDDRFALQTPVLDNLGHVVQGHSPCPRVHMAHVPVGHAILFGLPSAVGFDEVQVRSWGNAKHATARKGRHLSAMAVITTLIVVHSIIGNILREPTVGFDIGESVFIGHDEAECV